ncbi:phenylacetate--CoA ligase family protein [Acrocarpospora catenulata]|uniref:phenylacetate--CoA ligase family protein n=1 Tax=Acrocarpospora catenulata TaxID=2836182 RepID=UPI001BDAA264|nr:hypothetical protein [Acrocarpospora catenulata]
MTRAELASFQDRKFARFVRDQVAPNVEYYRRNARSRAIDLDAVESIADWQRLGLPLVTKAEYRRHTQEFVASPVASRSGAGADGSTGTLPGGAIPPSVNVSPLDTRPVLVGTAPVNGDSAYRYFFEVFTAFHTGGSTGEPTAVHLTRFDCDLYDIAGSREVAIAALHLWRRNMPCRAANLYPFAIHKGWWTFNNGVEKVADFSLRSAAGGAIATERLARHLLQSQVNLMFATPSFLRNRLLPVLTQASRDTGISVPPVVVCCLGGEPILPSLRADVEDSFHAIGAETVIQLNTYGSTEGRFGCFSECAPGTGYHGWGSDLSTVRLIDFRSSTDWEFVEEGGEGYIAVFPLDGSGSVLPGFVTGDRAVSAAGPCEHCGSSVDRLLSIGRVQDVASQLRVMGTVESKVKGTTVNLTDLRATLLDMRGVREVQVVIDKSDPSDLSSLDVLKLRVAISDDVEPADLIQNVASTCKSATEVTPHVEVMELGALLGEGVKFRTIDDRRAGRTRL